jgi:hypothetical protein
VFTADFSYKGSLLGQNKGSRFVNIVEYLVVVCTCRQFSF